ncbi:hypothetical protein [Ralstonia soli]|uniref:Uncharacterized protein n=1 Tax=Ralstonia soli TaxID=2953896 RepID=A0ABT1ALG2_9RALS|nr:hypothetical protein [Ralstonia soli]MCO5399121.1 hypothetical protein [Ralstonia soli]
MAREFRRWVRHREGQLISAITEAGAFVCNGPDIEVPDLQIIFRPAKQENGGRTVRLSHGISAHINLCAPKARAMCDWSPRIRHTPRRSTTTFLTSQRTWIYSSAGPSYWSISWSEMPQAGSQAAALPREGEGFDAQVVADASGLWSKMSGDIALRRMEHVGVTLTSTIQLIAELAGNWSTPEGSQLVQVIMGTAQA